MLTGTVDCEPGPVLGDQTWLGPGPGWGQDLVGDGTWLWTRPGWGQDLVGDQTWLGTGPGCGHDLVGAGTWLGTRPGWGWYLDEILSLVGNTGFRTGCWQVRVHGEAGDQLVL